jgi:P27 family predicted phage terminase small subunit
MKNTPPRHLQPTTKRWWRSVVDEWVLNEHHVRILSLACEAWDRGQQAREILEREGLTYVDRFGQPTARPEVAIERDSRLAFARLVRELDLDSEVTPESRLPSLRSNRPFSSYTGGRGHAA